jgi:hypothetical protein
MGESPVFVASKFTTLLAVVPSSATKDIIQAAAVVPIPLPDKVHFPEDVLSPNAGDVIKILNDFCA